MQYFQAIKTSKLKPCFWRCLVHNISSYSMKQQRLHHLSQIHHHLVQKCTSSPVQQRRWALQADTKNSFSVLHPFLCWTDLIRQQATSVSVLWQQPGTPAHLLANLLFRPLTIAPFFECSTNHILLLWCFWFPFWVLFFFPVVARFTCWQSLNKIINGKYFWILRQSSV